MHHHHSVVVRTVVENVINYGGKTLNSSVTLWSVFPPVVFYLLLQRAKFFWKLPNCICLLLLGSWNVIVCQSPVRRGSFSFFPEKSFPIMREQRKFYIPHSHDCKSSDSVSTSKAPGFTPLRGESFLFNAEMSTSGDPGRRAWLG